MEKTLNQYPEILRVSDIKSYLKIGKSQSYDLVHSKQFHSVRAGTTILIFRKVFESWLNGLLN